MKRVIIDTRLSGLKNAGIGRYTEMLVEHLGKLQTPSSKIQIIEISPDVKHYSLAEQIRMPTYLLRLKPDLVHFPHFNVPILFNKPMVVTIHDLLWHEQIGFGATTLSKWKYIIKYFGYRMVMRSAVGKARAIIVPSRWVKKRLMEIFPKTGRKTKVIYEGVADPYRETGNMNKLGINILSKYGLEEIKYLIYTGSLYPHKNLEVVLEALPKFPDLKLVVVCARKIFWDRFTKKVKMRGLTEQVVMAGYVPDSDLAVLYRGAEAMVLPSKSEGFGLPGLEAMAAGCPVISSSAGSLPEIYDQAAAFFHPDSAGELISVIKKIKVNRGYRGELIKRGKIRSDRFSWDKCAGETLEVYESCLGL